MKSFGEFLRYTSNIMANCKTMDINLCIGNVAADMDSIIGSMILAYSLSESGRLTIPTINCTKYDLSLRYETYKLLHQHDLLNHLLYFNDLNFQKLSTSNKVGVVLFDHNFPDTTQHYLEKNINLIIDHHWDYRKFNCKRKHIAFCGSASSIAVTLYGKYIRWDQELSKLALSPILLDCENFNSSFQNVKWNHIDLDAFRILRKHIGPLDTNHYYHQLRNYVHDVDLNLSLGLNNLLIKDFKTYSISNRRTYGSSVLSLSPTTIFKAFGIKAFTESIDSLMTTRKLDFYIVNWLCMESTNKHREIMFMCKDSKMLTQFIKLFESNNIKQIGQLHEMEAPSGIKHCIMYHMSNLGTTRKLMEPAFNEIFRKLYSKHVK